jgi:ABC-type multidrug transport system fused ATPase/permease subunit
MAGVIKLTLMFSISLVMCTSLWGQEKPVAEQSKSTVDAAKGKLDDLSERVNQSEQAQRVRAGILKPIYSLAKTFSFSAFHWAAFSVMVAGVVSFALQLTLGKLVVLSKFSFSLSEILSDALGLAVSVVGLVLTTQAATENSNFPANAFAVISSTCLGAVVGFVFYIWGQRQELQAVEGRKRAAALDHGSTTARV